MLLVNRRLIRVTKSATFRLILRLNECTFTGNDALFVVHSTLTNIAFLALCVLGWVTPNPANAHKHATSGSEPFIVNKGQWHQNVLYRANLPNGYLFLEQQGFTYSFYDGEPLHMLHAKELPEGKMPEELDAHAFKVHFENCNPNAEHEAFVASSGYHNYFLGNDPSKWATDVHSYGKVRYKHLYDGIDMAIYDQHGVLKYDFLVAPEADPNEIVLDYEGVDRLKLERGNLVITTSVNEMVEQRPVAFQIVDGHRVSVPCKFVLKGDKVTFKFPRGYDETKELIIDPILIFGTYSGSSSNNFGFTATYDNDGNLYGGGIVFTATGVYPTTVGAFQVSTIGGTIDMGITKFTADGTNLIYSTYIGGTANESPHSMVVNDNDELIIMGTTGSNNFPVTNGAYDQTFNGGNPIAAMVGYGYDHALGTDIVVVKLNAAGNNLIGSTYVGGTNNDGITFVDSLDFNYGDTFRGEVIVDSNGNILVASTTASNDFPQANAPQAGFGGGARDGCVFRLNPTLGALMWSTFIGGSANDAAYSVQLSSSNDIYVCGGTMSSDFPATPNTINPTYQGSVDGYIVRYNAAGGAILNATYIGTPNHDQTYFIQLDPDDDVYVVGQSVGGTYPVNTIYPQIYSNPNSAQFVHKMNPTLQISEWSTVLGTGNGSIDFSICAFLVSNCDKIYISGWGGTVNLTNRGFLLPLGSTTIGLPITSNAHQSATDGSDFYLMVLDEEADSLEYATFFGGGSSNEHVDGGTSRFDKDGKVYQAVCAGCGGFDDFPTTPNAYSSLNNSSCNLGVFKFDLAPVVSYIGGTPTFLCLPDSMQFSNGSTGANTYFWDFGDGTTSTDYEPYHAYDSLGVYNVMLIASDSNSTCIPPDTSFLTIAAYPPTIVLAFPDTICPGDTVQINASGGDNYTWDPPWLVSDPNISNPLTWPGGTTIYNVTVDGPCFSETESFAVYVEQNPVDILPDTFVCIGGSTQLYANGGVSYSWSPAATLDDPNIQNPIATPTQPTDYIVEVTTALGCVFYDTMSVGVDFNPPVPQLTPDTTICIGDEIQLTAGGAQSYVWSPGTGLSDPNSSTPIASPDQTTTYLVDFINGCGAVQDSITVSVSTVTPGAIPDQFICLGDTALLGASGGVSYLWSPAASLNQADTISPLAWPTEDTEYMVLVTNAFGCVDTAYTNVFLYPVPFLSAGEDQVINWGSSTSLEPVGAGTFAWTTTDTTITCTDCPFPTVSPLSTTSYIVTLTDNNGCTSMDTVTVFIDGSLYVPNTFTPNDDGINDVFFAQGEEIETFQLLIFNRWGELIFESDDINRGWDGRVAGELAQIDTYVWKINYVETSGQDGEVIGHVNLVR